MKKSGNRFTEQASAATWLRFERRRCRRNQSVGEGLGGAVEAPSDDSSDVTELNRLSGDRLARMRARVSFIEVWGDP